MALDFRLLDASLKLYRSAGNTPELALSLYYLLVEEGAPPDPLPVETAWLKRSGAYVFLPTAEPIADPAAFVAALLKLLQPGPQSQWIAWLPSSRPVDGELRDLRLLRISKQVDQAEGRTVGETADLAFGNLALSVPGESLVGLDPAGATPAFGIRNDPTVGSTLALVQTGTTRRTQIPSATRVAVALAEPRIGAWTFPLDINRGELYQVFQAPDDFSAAPSAEVRYTFFDAGATQELRYPVLLGAIPDPRNPPQARLPLRVAIDPLHPVDSARTRFELDLPAFGGDGPELPLSLSFRTTAGHEIRLKPLAGAGFALARRPGDPVNPQPPFFLYLTPAGPFEATTAPQTLAAGDTALPSPIAEGAMLVMCGLYGTEFLLAAEEDRLELSGEQPANANGFPGPVGRPVLDGGFSSAWLKLVPGPKSGETFKGPIKQSYCVQAPDAVYFQKSASFPFPVAVGARLGDLSDPARTRPFPMAPYGWVYFSDPDREIENPNPGVSGQRLTDYENQVLSLARRDAIAVDRCLGPLYFDLATLTPFAGGFVQTPRGLLVELNDGSDAKRPAGTWKRLILARGPERPDQFLQYRAGTSPTGCTGAQGPFEVVSPLLSTALLSNAPFLVVTRPEPMGLFDNDMLLGEFPFRIAVSGADSGPGLGNNTVLIFKLAPGRSLADLAGDVAAWTDSATFVGDEAQARRISGQIQAFIAEAQRLSDEARARGAFDYFANFLSLVKSPAWSGILALNTPLDLKALPTDLKALLGGMRGERPLRGHHFGINLNQIRRDGGAEGATPLDKSSLFALVHYDQAFQTPTTDFDFQVLHLNALFDNSTLQRFESQIAFSVRTLFNDPVRLTKGGRNDRLDTNTIVIDGALQVQDGKTSVVFATNEIRVFEPAQGSGYRALSETVVTQAGLDPVSERVAGDAVIVDSSFVFDGALGFNLRSVSGAPPADLFSFGVKEDDPGTGLAFTSYSFALTTTVRADKGTLAPIRLDLLRLAFDDSDATPRENSLFATLPVQLVRFRLNPPANAAGSRRVEGIGLDAVDPEFALELQLVMGTLGALSSQSPLQGLLLLGWRSAGSLAGNDTVGMLFVPPQELAGSGGFKIQGVVSSFFGKVRLDRPKLTKEATGQSIYVFTLALVPVNFAIVGLPLVPLSAIRSLTFFGDFESLGSEDGTNLAWFVGEPLRSSAAAETRALVPSATAGLPVLAASGGANLVFTPALGVIAGLKPKIDPLATEVVNDAIKVLSTIPLGTATTLNDIYNDDANLPVSYDPGAGVTVWIDIQFINITFQAIFSDPAIYGGRIAIKNDETATGILKSLGGLKLEIAYRRISPELGAWSANLTLPAKFRKIEISDNYKLFLPTVGVIVYTNGDWRVDAGWPFDPSTALRLEFTVQGIPLQAAIGFFLAKLRSADNPAAFGDDFALIWSFGVGISFGVGKSFEKGPASLDVGAYLFLTLSGFLASKHGALTEHGVDYHWFAGQLGARLYGSGAVDFKIIKASLDIEALLVLSVAFETRHSTVLDLRFKFSVSLTVRIVIVKITLSFSAKFTLFSVTFGSGPPALTDGPTPTAVPEPLTLRGARLLTRRPKELDPRLVRPLRSPRADLKLETAAQVDVRLGFLLQTTAVDTGAAASAPQTVATLLIKLVPDGAEIDDFARLVQGVGVWLATQFGGPPPLLDQLARIRQKIDDGSFAASLVDCLSGRFRFLLVPATGNIKDETAAVFPMFPQLKMTYHGAGIPFDLPLVPADYPRRLAEYFAQLATVPPSADPGLAALAAAGLPQSVAGIVFSDFFDVLGRQLVSELGDLAEADPNLTFEEALARLGPEGYANIAGAVSRFAQYGLAMPTPDSNPFGSKLAGVYQLTRQQVALVKNDAGAWDATFDLGYGTIDVRSWIAFGADGKLESITETLNPNLVLTEKISPTWLTTGGGFRQLAPIRAVDEISYLGDVRTWTRADGSQANLRALPDALQIAVDARAPLDATVQVVPGTPELNLAEETLEVLPAAAVLFVTLQLLQIPSADGGEPMKGVYQLVGTDEATRDRIEELLRIGVAGATLNMLAPVANSAYRSSVKDSSIVLAKTNLSTLSQPPTLFLVTALAEAPPPPPDHARLADVERFLRLVWELSVVHSGGFFLYMSDLPADAFKSGRADIALLVTFGPPVAKPRLQRYQNMLLLDRVPPDSTLGVTVTDAAGQTFKRWEPNYPGGWVGFEIQWPSPPTEPGLPESPTPEQKAKYLEALYSILQYRVEAVQAPEPRLLRLAALAPALPSHWSLPIGQQQTQGWSYRQTLPVARFLGQANRYAGIGLAARFGVRLIDLYGNTLPVLNPVPVQVIYNDPLTALGGWPGTESTYVFTADTDNRALLHVLLTLRPQVPGGDAAPDREWALQARLTYELVRDQLSDPNAFTAVLTVLSAQPLASDTDGRPLKERLLSYVGDVVLPYLDRVIGGETPPLPPPFEVLLAVDRGHVAELDDDIFRLDMSLEIWRDPAKVDPAVRQALRTVQSVSSPLAPVALTNLEASTDPPGKDDTLRAFAESFERAWAGFKGQGLLKLAEGAEAQAERKGGTSRQLWAVRWGHGAGILASFPNTASQPPVDDLPVSFSQVPLSTQLLTGTVEVRIYKDPWTGTGSDVDRDELRTFSNIDLDLWGRVFLVTFEQVLTAGMATAIATLDGARYTSLISYKEQLANTLQLTLENVLLVPGQAVDPAAARERFRQALLQSLASNYTLSSVMQIPADVEAARKKEPPIPPNLYGDVNPPQVPDSLAFSLSPAKLATARGRVPMPYLVSTKNPAAQAHLELDLGYTVTFVEHDFDPARSFFGYVPSSYISFITPLFAPAGGPPPLALPLGVNRIPIPLRAYPGVPALPVQEPVVPGKPATLAEALRWKYRFTVTSSQSAQDRLTLRVIFNEPPPETRETSLQPALRFAAAGEGDPPRPEPKDLFAALARFAFEYPQIEPYLAKVPDAAFQGRDVAVALKALERFEGLVRGVAATWKTWRNPGLAELQMERRAARLAAGADPNLPQERWVYVVDYQKQPALVVTRSIEGSASLPPWLEIQGFQTPQEQGQKTAEYSPLTIGSETGLLVVSVPTLFLMTRQSARTTALIERNANLVPPGSPPGTSVNPAFVYTTPVVELQDPVVPLVNAADAIALPPAPSLTAAIDQLFEPFVQSGDPSLKVQELRFSLDSFYQYRLAAASGSSDQVLISSAPNFLVREDAATDQNTTGTPPRKLAEVKKEIAQALTAWYRAMRPSDLNAQLRFALTAYAILGAAPGAAAPAAELPLVRFSAVLVPVPPNQPSWWNG